jgi:hypothetical protein
MSKTPRYSPDLIRRYREMDDANAFRRTITEVVPIDLDRDLVTLACGHQQELSRLLLRPSPSQAFDCDDCRNQWLAQAVAEEEKQK